MEPRGRFRFWALLGSATLPAGGLWLWAGRAPLAGASGWDSALFAAAALDLAARPESPVAARRLGALALLLFFGKVAAEIALGRTLFLRGSGPEAAPVHLLAGLAAIGVWLLFRLRTEGRDR